MRRLLLLAIVAMHLPGCVVSNIPRDTAEVRSHEGILVTNIVSNAGGYKLAILEKYSLVSSAVLEISSGQNFRVIALPAGDYVWRGIYVGTRYSEFGGKYNFKIVAGTLNYVGDIYIEFDPGFSKFHMELADDSLEARKRFKEVYPALSASYAFRNDLLKQEDQ